MIPKFRVWRKDEKEMYDQEEIDEGGMFPQINFYSKKKELLGRFENLSKAIVNVGKNLILMQSTGLKDKNGKEIFEGDIVKGIMTDRSEHYLEIIFDGIMWIGRKSDGDIEVLDDFGDCPNYNLEVIGNIHENPELLKGVKK